MTQTKQKNPILHKASAVETFSSLCSMPSYGKILLEHSEDKLYHNFLSWLIENNLLADNDERILIKQIAERYNAKPAKVTEWIKNIYEDIFTLNFEKPELFYHEGVKVHLGFRHYDDFCLFKMSLPVLPRQFEQVDFYFLTAKIGSSTFWVKNVKHDIENDKVIPYLSLESGFPNKYREFTLDKALFQNKIGLLQALDNYPFEVDRILNELYRN